MKWLPNALTILRCILAFVVGWMIWLADFGAIEFYIFNNPPPTKPFEHNWQGWPFLLFVFAAVLDYADGAAARALNAESEFGAKLDPLADKLLVGVTLIMICQSYSWHWIFVVPTFLIVGRDILVSILRSRVKSGIPVTRAAKWKTAIAMIAVGGLLFTFGAHAFGVDVEMTDWIGYPLLALLYLAAALSLSTAWQYVRAATR